jgi:hypothetical protein
MPTGVEIIKRRDLLRANRDLYTEKWDRIAKLFDPTTIGTTSNLTPGAPIMQQNFDSTGQQALDILGKFITAELMNPSRKYVAFKPSDPRLDNDDAIKEWCEECRDRTLEILARSNFYTEGALAIKQDAGFGSASLFWGQRVSQPWEKIVGFRGLRFQCDRVGRFLIATNANGEVDTNFREFKLSARAADKMFPKAPPGTRFSQYMRADKVDEETNFIHAVYPREEKGYGNKGMPWASCYVEEESKIIVDESGFNHFPFACPRWDVMPNETYGRGAAELAYNTMATKNKAREMTLEALAIKIRPPVFARHDSVIGTLRIKPAGYTAINTHGLPINQAIMPFDAGGDFKLAQMEDEKLKQEVRSMLYVDVIQQVLEMELKDVNNYTFAKKLELLYWVLGSVYGRFEREFLRALFDPLFMYLYENRQFSPPPDALLASGGSIDIEFDNPLAKAQGAKEVNSLNLAFQDLAPVIAYQTQISGRADILDVYNWDAWAEQVNKLRGVPATVTRSEQEIAKIRKARIEAQQNQAQMDQIQQGAEAAGKVAPLLTALQGGKQQAA